MPREKPPLTSEEREEKRQLNVLFLRNRTKWKAVHGKTLTQALLGQIVGEMIKGEPMTQGAIWQYLAEESDTKLNAPVVQAIAAVCDFEPAEVAARFEPKEWLGAASRGGASIEDAVRDLNPEEVTIVLEKWAAGINPKLAMKMAQALLAQASAEL